MVDLMLTALRHSTSHNSRMPQSCLHEACIMQEYQLSILVVVLNIGAPGPAMLGQGGTNYPLSLSYTVNVLLVTNCFTKSRPLKERDLKFFRPPAVNVASKFIHAFVCFPKDCFCRVSFRRELCLQNGLR